MHLFAILNQSVLSCILLIVSRNCSMPDHSYQCLINSVLTLTLAWSLVFLQFICSWFYWFFGLSLICRLLQNWRVWKVKSLGFVCSSVWVWYADCFRIKKVWEVKCFAWSTLSPYPFMLACEYKSRYLSDFTMSYVLYNIDDFSLKFVYIGSLKMIKCLY